MKDKTTAAILALLFGGIGIHKFYLGSSKGFFYLIPFFVFLFVIPLPFISGIIVVIGFIESIQYFSMEQEKWDTKYNLGKTNSLQKFDIAEELEKLHSLKEKGIINEEEFNAKKQQMLK